MPSATFRTVLARTGVAVLVPALLLFLLLLRPVFDTDIFWQLKLGELILAARHPIKEHGSTGAQRDQPVLETDR